MKSRVVRSAIWFVFVGCAIAFAPSVAPLAQFSDGLLRHPEPYLAVAIGVTVVGLGLFAVFAGVAAFSTGRRMTDLEARDYAGAGLHIANRGFFRNTFRGTAVGQQVVTGDSFAAIKDAFRSGAWIRDAGWRSFLLTAAGALLWLYGGFAIALVIGPPAVKLIVGVVLAYVTGRLCWSMYRA